MKKATRFVFCGFGRTDSTVDFRYRTEFEDGSASDWTERLAFPTVPSDAWKPEHERMLEAILLALGMSYWKMDVAPEIVIDGFELTDKQAAFWNTLYTKGLGEFFYRNRIDFRGLVRFPAEPRGTPSIPLIRGKSEVRSLLPVGGGKDSLVSLEMLKASNMSFDLYSLNTSTVQTRLAESVDAPYHVVTRTLDPAMIARSKAGEVYNGHVPITSIYTFVGVLLASLIGDSYVVLSSEKSANSGNVEYLGEEINHQWSKSEEFERMVSDYVRNFLTTDVVPFSLLRPLSELEIVRRFTKYPQYFRTFSSCNRNFTIAKRTSTDGERAYWCGECPKCAFVFACLAAFLPKADVVEIFGKNLFADASLVPLYRSLLGVADFKPFECVGTADETAVAFERARQTGSYSADAVMQMFEQEVRPTVATDLPRMEREALSVGSLETIPEEFRSLYQD